MSNVPVPSEALSFLVGQEPASYLFVFSSAAATASGGGGGVSDHGGLTGLSDDDHPQYHNNTRGDLRYSLLAHTHSGVYDPAGTAAAAMAAHLAAGDPHPQYTTAVELNAAIAVHEAASDPHPGYLTTAEGAAADAALIVAHNAATDPHGDRAFASAADAAAMGAHNAATDPHGDRAFATAADSTLAGTVNAALALKLDDLAAGTDAEMVGVNAAGTVLQRLGYTVASLLTAAYARASHTGSQLAATISDFTAAALLAVTWSTLTGKPSTFDPAAHKTSHATGGSDVLTAADIGAATSGHNHAGVYQPLATVLTDTTASFLAADRTKLDGIAAGADVTSGTNVGTVINAATAKATPVDADTFPITDSAASNVIKKVSWANIKATLQAFFDGLYAPKSATRIVEMLNASTAPDATGDAFFEPASITGTNDLFRHMVLRLGASNVAAPTVKSGVYGRFTVPEDYNTGGTVTCIVVWSSTLTSGDAVLDLDYRAVGSDNSESLDQTTAQESLSVTDTAPSSANLRMTATMTFTAGNLLAGDTVEFFFGRDGAASADTLAGSVLVHSVTFRYTT